MSGQHTRLVVANKLLDTGRGNNYSVDSPNATVFEVGLRKERTIRGEEFCSGDRVGLGVVEPGVLGTVGDYWTGERGGIGRAREGVGRSVRGAGDVSEFDIEVTMRGERLGVGFQ